MIRKIPTPVWLTIAAFLSVLLIVIIVIGSRSVDNKGRVIFDNQSKCGTIAVQLTDDVTGEVKKDKVPVSTSKTIEVKPDTVYKYVVDFTAGGTQKDNTRCTAIESGTVKVPAGTAQTFTLTNDAPVSATPYPTVKP